MIVVAIQFPHSPMPDRSGCTTIGACVLSQNFKRAGDAKGWHRTRDGKTSANSLLKAEQVFQWRHAGGETVKALGAL
ncbi:hypothetical protein [Rhizobium sp. SSA_523]|uniref:hypothetical protein n=1 Tax=Rhizobium sp. SSA_523 TaxID=2952477 RepID=UPI002090D1B9|nr:hypothetical protein [Rhizobium sp. SSA_523]MCO5733618.1 hypothetical protein [Rhizobium sp. SSA_523]WKC23085.1 hypothetical protein QTJ18_19965 [Rhizobium sp. SSA_523]